VNVLTRSAPSTTVSVLHLLIIVLLMVLRGCRLFLFLLVTITLYLSEGNGSNVMKGCVRCYLTEEVNRSTDMKWRRNQSVWNSRSIVRLERLLVRVTYNLVVVNKVIVCHMIIHERRR
jgi:hypothetical protein